MRKAIALATALGIASISPANAWEWPGGSGQNGTTVLAGISDWFGGSVLQGAQSFYGYVPTNRFATGYSDPIFGQAGLCDALAWDGTTCLKFVWYPNLDAWKCQEYLRSSKDLTRLTGGATDTRQIMCLGSPATPFYEGHSYTFNGNLLDLNTCGAGCQALIGVPACPLKTAHTAVKYHDSRDNYVYKCAAPLPPYHGISQADAEKMAATCRNSVLDGTPQAGPPWCEAVQEAN